LFNVPSYSVNQVNLEWVLTQNQSGNTPGIGQWSRIKFHWLTMLIVMHIEQICAISDIYKLVQIQIYLNDFMLFCDKWIGIWTDYLEVVFV